MGQRNGHELNKLSFQNLADVHLEKLLFAFLEVSPGKRKFTFHFRPGFGDDSLLEHKKITVWPDQKSI